MTGNLQADGVQSRQTLFVRYCLRKSPLKRRHKVYLRKQRENPSVCSLRSIHLPFQGRLIPNSHVPLEKGDVPKGQGDYPFRQTHILPDSPLPQKEQPRKRKDSAASQLLMKKSSPFPGAPPPAGCRHSRRSSADRGRILWIRRSTADSRLFS